MAELRTIKERHHDLFVVLAEQQGAASYRNPARRRALMMAERIAREPEWYHSNENAVLFMGAFKKIAGRMARSTSIHPDLRRRLAHIAETTDLS